MEKKNVVIFIVSFIILALAGIGFFAWRGTRPIGIAQPQPRPVANQIPVDWKTYTNTKYHYSFRYPKEYYIYQWSGQGNFMQINPNSDEVWITDKKESDPIFTISSTNINPFSMDSIKSYYQDPKSVSVMEIAIDNQTAYKLEFKIQTPGVVSDFYFVKNLDLPVLEITVYKENAIAKEIFSSFRLIK